MSPPAAPLADRFFRLLLENASDLVAVLDADGRLRYASPSHRDVLGIAPADLIGRDAFELVHPDDRAALFETFAGGVARGENTDTGEFRYRCADGGWRVLDGVGHNLLADPTIAGVVVISRDITERRRSAEELENSRRRVAAQLAELELLYRTAPVGLSLVDTELRYIRINDRLAAMHGLSAEAHIGLTLFDVIPTLVDEVVPLFRRVIATGEAVLDVEVSGPAPTSPGERHDWLVSYYPVRAGAGKIFGVSAVVQDITERRQVQRALEEARSSLEQRVRDRTGELQAAVARLEASEQRYRELVESLHDIVFTLDAAGVVTYISPSITPASGYAPEEVIGKPFARHIHPDDLSEAVASLARTIAGDLDPFEFRVFDKQGAVRWVRSLSRLTTGRDGAPELRGVMTDVTARRQAEDLARRLQGELAHVQRVATIGEMTAQVAHEINQPLAAIVNFADGLLLRLREGPVTADALSYASRQIAAEGRRAAEVIRRLREFVRKGELQTEPSDLNQLVREVLELLAADARRHAIGLRLDLDAGLRAVRLDRIQIQQVVVNLVRNAFESVASAGASGRLVVIETHSEELRGARLAVRDNGVGLPSSDAGDIFEPFYTTKRDGLGIGLAISRSIVEAHGGRLWAEPNPDRGATFQVYLPERGDRES